VPEHIIYHPLDAIGCEKWIFVSKPIHPLVVGLAARRGSRDETFSGNQHEKTSGYIGYMWIWNLVGGFEPPEKSGK